MKPDELSSGQGGTPLSNQRLSNSTSTGSITPSQNAAADVIRGQINNIFNNNSSSPDIPKQQVEIVSPYNRTHKSHVPPQDDQWKQYHTAWQTYYQKYYEGYYTHHLHNAKTKLEEQLSKASAPNNQTNGFGSQPEANKTTVITTEEAVSDLRKKLLSKTQEAASKVKKSRHFKPIAAGLIVVLIFLFLQYNRLLISSVAAYISPGSINPQNIIINPSSDVKVGPEPRLIIPKINVDVPVMYDVGSDYTSQMKAMETGVAHFAIPGANSHPGQVGNTVIAGHSSNDLLDSGDYKFIFVQLDKLDVGDTIYANYQTKRYTYIVTKKEVVKPTDVNKLVYLTTKPILTLITCTPIGTATSRLLITAEQVSPDPNQSTAAPVIGTGTSSSIPGNSPTLFERIFGK